jgi:hypothetical protein
VVSDEILRYHYHHASYTLRNMLLSLFVRQDSSVDSKGDLMRVREKSHVKQFHKTVELSIKEHSKFEDEALKNMFSSVLRPGESRRRAGKHNRNAEAGFYDYLREKISFLQQKKPTKRNNGDASNDG